MDFLPTPIHTDKNIMAPALRNKSMHATCDTEQQGKHTYILHRPSSLAKLLPEVLKAILVSFCCTTSLGTENLH